MTQIVFNEKYCKINYFSWKFLNVNSAHNLFKVTLLQLPFPKSSNETIIYLVAKDLYRYTDRIGGNEKLR